MKAKHHVSPESSSMCSIVNSSIRLFIRPFLHSLIRSLLYSIIASLFFLRLRFSFWSGQFTRVFPCICIDLFCCIEVFLLFLEKHYTNFKIFKNLTVIKGKKIYRKHGTKQIHIATLG